MLVILNSEFSFSDFNSNSTFNIIIFASLNFFGCCSNPAYEKLFLNATPSTKNESVIEPPVTCFIPIKSLSLYPSNFYTASTTIFVQNSLSFAINFEFNEVCAHFNNKFFLSCSTLSSIIIAHSSNFSLAKFKAVQYPLIIT